MKPDEWDLVLHLDELLNSICSKDIPNIGQVILDGCDAPRIRPHLHLSGFCLLIPDSGLSACTSSSSWDAYNFAPTDELTGSCFTSVHCI